MSLSLGVNISRMSLLRMRAKTSLMFTTILDRNVYAARLMYLKKV